MTFSKEDWAGAVLFLSTLVSAVYFKEGLLWLAAGLVGFVFVRRWWSGRGASQDAAN